MSETITKACETCGGTGTVTLLGIDDDGPCEAERMCHDCDGTGRVPDAEATLRAQLDAARAEVTRLKDVAGAAHGLVVALRKPDVAAWDAAERAVVLTLNASGTDWLAEHVRNHNGPERIAELLVEKDRLTSELDAARAEVTRLTEEAARKGAAFEAHVIVTNQISANAIRIADKHDRLRAEVDRLTAREREAARILSFASTSHASAWSAEANRWLAGCKS